MKPGVRALGIAESFRDERSTISGVVSTADGVVDGVSFTTCTVGGDDVTQAIEGIWADAGRPDVQYVFLAGVALAWYNIVELHRLDDAIDVPVLAITFEASDGLEPALRAQFEGMELTKRMERFRRLPPRREVIVGDDRLWVRTVDPPDVDVGDLLSHFTRAGGRPEPIRVARLAARAADRMRRHELDDAT